MTDEMTERLSEALRERGATIVTAESCTGGAVAAALTARAGASDYFLGGVVSYSNDMKAGVLGVDRDTLAEHGAVSRQVAEQMALGVKRISGADYSVATTGIAGPGGGTSDKPVGTVWIAVSTPDGGVVSRREQFHGTRTQNIDSTVAAAIGMVSGAIKS